jgi:hypothetical protein
VGLIRSRIDHRDLRGIDSHFCANTTNTPPGKLNAFSAIATIPRLEPAGNLTCASNTT